MQLWTWQKKCFSLSKGKIDSQKHSPYLNDPNIPKSERQRFQKVYAKLWEQLGTNQFLWCYTQEEAAKSEQSKLEYKGEVLWEIDMPENQIFRIVCGVAWNWILTGKKCNASKKLRHVWWREAHSDHYVMQKLEQDFHDYWAAKSGQKLWDTLFLNKAILSDKTKLLYKSIEECITVLVQYPIKKSWIISSRHWCDVFPEDEIS
jgi:hypothetical protein